MRKGRCGSYNHLSSLQDAGKPEYPQISNLWRRVRLADHRDVGAVCYFYCDAPNLHVFFPGLKNPVKYLQ